MLFSTQDEERALRARFFHVIRIPSPVSSLVNWARRLACKRRTTRRWQPMLSVYTV